jgi:methionyl-tRNA formyltransferase
LDVPKRGTLNVHPSLLPRWRGASPVAAAILAGDELTGVTIMEMVRALDAGPMVARLEVAISPHDTTGTLEARLAQDGADLLARNIDAWASRDLTPQPQDESLVTYAPQIQRQEGRIDWSQPATDIWRRVRAYSPWPAAFTTSHGEELKVWLAWPLEGDSAKAPGTVLGLERLPDEAREPAEALIVQTGAGRLALRSVQRAGRKATTGAEFLRGQRDLIDTRLGD